MDLNRYRPIDATAAAVAAALVAAQADVAVIESRANAAKLKRDALLLDGAPKVLAEAETALAAARGDRERLDAIVETLTSRLAVAQRTDAVERVRAAERVVAEANATMNLFTERSGASLIELLERGWKLQVERLDASVALEAARLNVFHGFKDGTGDAVTIPETVMGLTPDAQSVVEIFEEIGTSLFGTVVQPIVQPPSAAQRSASHAREAGPVRAAVGAVRRALS